MIDIDHFKSINDKLGRAGGDQVLKELSQLLRANLRADDVIARFGGEEFVALLPGSESDALHVADRLRTAIEGHNFGIGSQVTASMGVAHWHIGRTVDDLIVEADAHLYEAKRGGRNRVMPGLLELSERG